MKTILIGTLFLFGFVALVFEPLYYFGCHWNDINNSCDSSPYEIVKLTASIWRIYNNWDPIFMDIPLWLRVLCSIEVFVFGPLYIICAIGLIYNCKWMIHIGNLFAGALIYSTIVYFAMEFIDPIPTTNLLMVLIVNIPWTMMPIMLSWYMNNVFQVDLKQLSMKQRMKVK